jgi:hypothetical protein
MIRARISSLILTLLAVFISATASQAKNLEEVGREFGNQCAKEHPKNEPNQSECVREKCEAAFTDNRQRLVCQVKALEALMALAVPDPQKRKIFEDLIRLPKGKTIGRACVSKYPNDFTSQKHCIEQACSKWFTGAEEVECHNSCLQVITQAAGPTRPKSINSSVNSTGTITESSIKTRCAKLWPGDYQIVGNCINRQIEAANNFKTLMDTYPEGTKERHIMLNCAALWKDGDTYDFVTVIDCTNRQLEAYKRLHQ